MPSNVVTARELTARSNQQVVTTSTTAFILYSRRALHASARQRTNGTHMLTDVCDAAQPLRHASRPLFTGYMPWRTRNQPGHTRSRCLAPESANNAAGSAPARSSKCSGKEFPIKSTK